MAKKVLFKDCKFLYTSPVLGGMKTGLSILIEGKKIIDIAPFTELKSKYGRQVDDCDIIDASNKIVMPGLFDAHNHLCNTHMNLSRAFGINYDSVNDHMFTTVHDPYGWHTEESLFDVSLLSALNDIKHGATTIENSTILPDAAHKAMKKSGCRGILAPQMATSFQLDNERLNWKEYLTQAERCIKEYHNPEEKMSVAVHIHDQWDTLEEVMIRGMEMAEEYDVKYVTHFWEFPDSTRKADLEFESEGGAFLHYLNKGLINDRCVFFHGSMLSEHEIDMLSETGASVIHNPDINGTNCGNCAYIPYMLDKGVNVGIGSDYGSLDALTSMKLALLVHNIQDRPLKGIKGYQAFYAATMGGAKAYGMDEETGSIEVGKKADIVTIDLTKASHLAPMATSAIPYAEEILMFLFVRNCAGTETCETMIDGEFIRRDGNFTQIDEEEILRKANLWFEKFIPDLAQQRKAGKHYATKIHEDYLKDSEVDLQSLL